MAQHRHTPIEAELLVFVSGVRDSLSALTVMEGDVRQIGNLSLHREKEGDLQVFTAHLRVTEEVGVGMIGFENSRSPIEGTAELDDRHVCLCEDGFQHLLAVSNGGRKWLWW